MPRDWRRGQKYQFLKDAGDLTTVGWQELKPDARDTWLTSNSDTEFAGFIAIGLKEAKASSDSNVPVIFQTYSLGVSTNRDSVVYDFDAERLAKRVKEFCDDYNAELHRWQKKGCPADLDAFLSTDKVKWSETLKRKLASGVEAKFSADKLGVSDYRPFTRQHLYYDSFAIDRPGNFKTVFPNAKAREENAVILVSTAGITFTILGFRCKRNPKSKLCLD